MTTPSKRLPKFRRARRAAPALRLTDRDRAVLYDLYHYRFLPTSLIQRRHFGSPTRARNRLKLLFHHGFVDRTFLPSAGPSTSEALYSLGPAATAELAAVYGLEPADVQRRRRPVEPFFIAHELLVARFRLSVAYAGASKGVGIRQWTEREAAKLRVPATGPDGSATERPITPDGMGWVYSPAARFAFCLEADRGTMTVGRVRAKFERYARAGAAVSERLGAARFRVLVVVPTERRLESLRRAAEAAGTPNVWLTSEAALEADLVAEPVWHRAGVAGRFSLFTPAQLGRDERRPSPPDPVPSPRSRRRPA